MKAIYVVDEKIKIRLLKEAYICNDENNDICYKASGVDDEGNSYTIKWQVLDPKRFEENAEYPIEDESEACDWEDYTITKD